MCSSHPAVAVLVAKRPQFTAFVARRVRDPEVVDEILQDSWLKALEHLDRVRDPEASVAWFWRILRNRTNDAWRAQDLSSRRDASDDVEVTELAARELEPEPSACRCAMGALAALKAEYVDILREVEMGGMPVVAYARSRGLTASNAGVRVFRAREALKRALANACGACATAERCEACACEAQD